MAVDCRQVLAGFLTVTMFVMLGNMIKRDHFDTVHVRLQETSDGLDRPRANEGAITINNEVGEGPWKEESHDLVKPCWSKPTLEDTQESKGYVIFSLTHGPEYHVSQVADAVMVARYLGATLVVPDIRGSKTGDKRNFKEIYDIKKFIKSLDGVVKVVKKRPTELSARDIAVVEVPTRVTEDYISENIEPVFSNKGSIRLASHFRAVNMKKTDAKSSLASIECLAMFGTLELQPAVREVVESMVERLRTLSRKSDGRFIAVDLRIGVLESKGCQESEDSGAKNCFDAFEIAQFLKKTGFDKDTTIYVTQSKWHSSLDSLKEFFPKVYIKEGIMPADKKSKFLDSDSSEFEKAIDFYICSQSDIFVPAISGLFYANVAGRRIASGKNQIIVPSVISGTSAPVGDFMSHYVSKKNHMAYSCFC